MGAPRENGSETGRFPQARGASTACPSAPPGPVQKSKRTVVGPMGAKGRWAAASPGRDLEAQKPTASMPWELRPQGAATKAAL